MKPLNIIVVALLALVAVFPTSASAQACNLILTFDVAYKDTVQSSNIRKFFGWDTAQVAQWNKRAAKVLDAGSRQQDKGGGYTVLLGQETNCDGKREQLPVVELRGLTIHGVNVVWKEANKVDDLYMADFEKAHAKGKHKAWGKD